jgi:hypothetical protein
MNRILTSYMMSSRLTYVNEQDNEYVKDKETDICE